MRALKILSLAILGTLVVLNGRVGHGQPQGGSMKITSSTFTHNQMIPRKYTCQGEDINPALTISAIPPATKSLALIVDDPDAPFKTWVHWVVFNIPSQGESLEIEENTVPGKQGNNDFGKLDYGGPCPPSGTHRYFFKVYALDTELSLKDGISKADLEKALKGHILASAELIGLYKKS